MRPMTQEEVKKIQLNILIYVDAICRQNDINYSLAFGTLIGAVRHRGFIPWDDDIDIILMRDEYKKLLKCLYMDKNDLYKVLSPRDEGYWYNYTKVTDKRTFIKEKNWPDFQGLGVNIDIFPLDFLPEDNPESFYNEAIQADKGLKYCLTDIAYKDNNFIKSCIKKLCRFNEVKKYRKRDEWHWKKEHEKIVGKSEPGSHIGQIVSAPYKIWKREWMETFTNIEFEGNEFQVTEEYDAMLKNTYGDYMKLPPEKERVSNHDFISYWK